MSTEGASSQSTHPPPPQAPSVQSTVQPGLQSAPTAVPGAAAAAPAQAQAQTQPQPQAIGSGPSQPNDFIGSIPLPNPPENTAATGITPKTLWMGDLEPWWDEGYIINIWKNLNKSVLVKVIKPKKNSVLHHIATNGGANLFNHSGYCFVEFETYEEAKEALAMNGSTIPGTNNKIFRLNWASGATLSSQIPQTQEFSCFVGDLSPSTTEAHLLALFQTSFKSVKTVRVMTDPATGSSRCFGFVRFTNEEDRRRALLEMNGVWLGGRPIRVALATPKHTNNNGFGGNNSLMDPTRNVGAPGIDQNQMFLPRPPIPAPGGLPYYPPHFNQQSPPAHSQAFNDPNNTTVFVGGLASGVPEDTLITLFEPFGTIVNVKIPPGKGCGFVKFAKREDAEQAIAGMQGFIIGGSRVRLSWGRSNHNNTINQQMLLRNQVGLSGGFDGYGVPPPPAVTQIPQGLGGDFPPPPQAMPPMYYPGADPFQPSMDLADLQQGQQPFIPQFTNPQPQPHPQEFQPHQSQPAEDVIEGGINEEDTKAL
ncbi:hypothetical protein PACTADRAFT_51193 [Pachysolen tannophilus NRRL Y-2460]|uniref:RRM domain-containing protein n=1 Tax=Pachysolen tannophilus NRRL Y-2460 TaxID=669874 RepID=A0A1E4TRE0_PACTA|nr:hypothetical protein PACTADRAFT_51193 [Pachysolen tannophilus NRRL Y-2460]